MQNALEKYRLVIELSDKGYSNSEIASRVNLSEYQVAMIIHRKPRKE